MKVHSFAYDLEDKKWSVPVLPEGDSPRTLVLVFGAPEVMDEPECMLQLAKAYPRSVLLGCSTSGEIHGTSIRDKSLSVTMTRFDKTDVVLASMEVDGLDDSFPTGQALAKKLASRPGLRGVLVLCDGLNVNGSELVRGLNSTLDESVVVTGGLAGDGTRFKRTWVAIGSKLKPNVVAAVGFYGDYVVVGHGSKGGWDKFGPERVVTRSEGNVLYELDGKPALQLYKEYLGEKAKELPASGLFFPLSVRASSSDDKALVRTVLAVDHEKNSLTFAGDMPKGYLAQLMRADFDRLIGGASLASYMAKETGSSAIMTAKDSLVLAISCVGRRIVLGARTEEEVEAVLDGLPKTPQTHITGFYAYGEISPYASGHCDLHNQTMTLTVFSESPTPVFKKVPKPATLGNGKPAVSSAKPAPASAAVGTSQASGPVSASDKPRSTSADGQPNGIRVESFSYDLDAKAWSVSSFPNLDSPRTLVLAFAAPEVMDQPECMMQLAKAYPRSVLLGCSTSGEIHGTSIRDNSVSVTVTRFDKTDLALASMEIDGLGESYMTGQALAKKLASRPGLRGVLVLCDGLNVNGSELVRGLNSTLDESVVVTGGLAGDGTRFKRTWVAIGSTLKPNVVAVVGFYGDHVVVGHGSKGGWDKFGPERVVTRSEGNVLYELDGKPALQLYKEYLGEKAKELPASGLFFPLSVRASSNDEKALVRTVLAVDHEKNSLTFAGDMPKGYLAQLMRADFDRLIGGASLAGYMAKETGNSPIFTTRDSLVLAISCVGRRIVLGARTEEEVEAVLDGLPKMPQNHITGFYAYGEISPYASGHCDLHNQTMTLTVFSESPTPIFKKVPESRDDRVMSPPSAKSPPVATSPAKAAKSPPIPTPADDTGESDLLMTSNTKAIDAPLSDYPERRVPVTRMPLQGSGATGANVQKQRRGDLTVLTISGRLTESFKGEALGSELSGNVVIDLAGVERITSFGVREWLAMLGAMQNVRRMHLIRCSEAIVNQLSMIRKFAGNGQIVSFFAPYICSGCGEQFERGFDCEHDSTAIREGQPEPATCPQCGGEGRFDDDPRSYFAFALQHQNVPVPLDVRAIQDERDAQTSEAPREAVDKTIDGNVTHVRVQGKLNASVRWKRVLDGIEGALIVDLGGATGVEPAGIENLEQALSALGPEVTSIGIERCPALLVERFAKTGAPKRLRIISAALDAYCRSCAVHRPALVSLDEHGEALAKGTPPHVHCKRCNGDLELRGEGAALRFFAAQLAPRAPAAESITPPAPNPAATTTTSTAGSTRSSVPPAPAARPFGATFAIGALSLAVVGLLATHVLRPAAPPAAAAPAMMTAPVATPQAQEQTKAAGTQAAIASNGQAAAWLQSVELPPAWVERPFVIEGSDVFVVGKGEPSATAELAMSQARNDAIVRILKQVQQELVGTTAHDFLQARRREPDKTAVDAIANRFLRQFGTIATPERVDAALRKREAGIEGFARYKLPRAAYQQVVAGYRETTSIQGMVIGRFFPLLETTLHTEGELVVLSVQRSHPADVQGVRAGDGVIAIDSRSVATLDSLTKLWSDQWSSAPGRGTVSVEIETAGAKRTLRFIKPSPQP